MVTERVRRGWVRLIGVLPVPEATIVVLKGTSLFRVCPVPVVPVLLPEAVCGLDREVFTVLAKVVSLTVVLVVAVVALVAVVVDIFEARTTGDAEVVFVQLVILELPGFTATLVDDLVVAVVDVELTLDLIVVEVAVVPTVLLFRLVVGTVGPGLLATLEADNVAAPDALELAFGFSAEISILAAVARQPDATVKTFPLSRVAATVEELEGLFLSEMVVLVDKLELLTLFLSKRPPTLPLSTPALTLDRLFFELITLSSFFLGFFSTVRCDVSGFTVSLSCLSSTKLSTFDCSVSQTAISTTWSMMSETVSFA